MNTSIKKIERYTLNDVQVPGWRFWGEYHQSCRELPAWLKAQHGDALDRGEVVSLAEFEFKIVYKS